ncbi:hypothetical protein QQX98_004578 [Neonectria punicea]|uniref:Cytochrome b5 heme-binding domain-containing protein n=1 Tax=Neonectria punicea TaxID=979145 RepID=A0ABR1H8L7_9HYPO
MAFTNTVSSLSLRCSSVLDSLFRCTQECDEQAYTDAIEDDRGRYRVWAANLGALQAPKSFKSLDYRLRDAVQMRDSVLSGLHRLISVSERDDSTVELGAADAGETVATSFEEGETAHHESKPGPSTEKRSIFTSATSYLSIYDDDGNMGRSIIDLSDMVLDGVRLGYDRDFECPFCRTIQNVANRSEWRKHVFGDLQPYVCTFEDCIPDMFSSRSEWFKHELDLHRREWHCSICNKPGAICGSAKDLKYHFDTAHGKEITAKQMGLVLKACERPLKYFDTFSCPLCNDWKPSVRQVEDTKEFGRHLARHLQQIALEALPLSIEGLELRGDLELTHADVAKHNAKNDNHVVVHDRVYDITKFVDEHPGGEEVLLDVAGTDATEAFEDVGHSDEARELLDEFLIGRLVERREDEFSSIIPGMGAS